MPSCTRNFHRLKDLKAKQHGTKDRVKLVERHKLCLGCLTSGHGHVGRSCPCKEERVGACQRPAYQAGHHYLLHMEKHKAKAKQGERPPAKSSGAVPEPTPTEEQGSADQLVVQWVNTRGVVPYLVSWNRGSQVTLTTH